MTTEPDLSAESILHKYYECFNAPRFTEAAKPLSPDCDFFHTATREHAQGRRGFRVLIDQWLNFVPDMTITPESVTQLGDGLLSARVRLRGHLRGDLQIGPSVISGNGQRLAIRGIHRVRVQDGQI